MTQQPSHTPRRRCLTSGRVLESRTLHIRGPVSKYPQLFQTVLDTENARELADSYRELLGLAYRVGDEPAAKQGDVDSDWLVLVDSAGGRGLECAVRPDQAQGRKYGHPHLTAAR